jgi:serine/threonine protein kinase
MCAIKRFTPRNVMQSKNIAYSFQKEREILQKLSTWRHLHIVDFIGSFEVRSESKFGHFDLILPYAEGGNLYEFLRLPHPPEWLYKRPECMPFCEALFVQMKGIVDALAFLHAKTSHAGFVIHRDIKPANILIFNGTFKLADFGSSRIKASEETSKTEWAMGTPMYEPPEKTIEDSDSHGRARDVWALGCVLLEILVLLTYGFREPAALDNFEEERINSTPRSVKAFSRTMASVEVWMASLGKLIEDHHQRNKDRWVDGDWNEEQNMLRALLAAIRGMMELNRAKRIESSQASECLHSILLI